MHVMMLSWEYPPRVVGGLARHVGELAGALVAQGIEVSVITTGEGTPSIKTEDGVLVARWPKRGPGGGDFLLDTMTMNFGLIEAAMAVERSVGTPDLIHGHDWLVAPSAWTLKHSWHRPLVSTIHATEVGRNRGLHNELQRRISDLEWALGFESWKVILCSQAMVEEVHNFFGIPQDKLAMIPNGITLPPKLDLDPAIRAKFAAPEEKIILYVGRLVPEKGVGVLIEAMGQVLAQHPQAKLVIVGSGYSADELKVQARALGSKVYFTGFISDSERDALYRAASVAVFPSLYEPFGIVALEGMSFGLPTIVGRTGGLAEIVDPGTNGLLVEPGNAQDLAGQINWVLGDPALARKLGAGGLLTCHQYSWERIAKDTTALYGKVLAQFQVSPWPENEEFWTVDETLGRIDQLFSATLHQRYQATHKGGIQ
jgi:glycosyltransferase involved in cell wall biosynthesis